MTTTVRIRGSRAREQVPGTGITLHAPGFRGSLTQLPPGAPDDAALAFADAAAGVDVKLAAQLTMHLEARPPDDGPELRSRSAVATFPRLIVPRRHGIAYALLQTDGTARLYAGAFKNKEEAGPLSELMRGAGIHTTVVFRTGRVY
jgi:hypothetical protein